jgi:hypothetical protein
VAVEEKLYSDGKTVYFSSGRKSKMPDVEDNAAKGVILAAPFAKSSHAPDRCYYRSVDLVELLRQSQDNLVTFLEIELDLANTMLKILNTTRDEDHRKRLIQNIQAVVDTVRHFEGRVEDRNVRTKLHAGVTWLEMEIEKGRV